MRSLVVIDTHVGNLASVLHALRRINPALPLRVAETAAELTGAAGLLLPGVGAFGDTMRDLEQRGLPEAICAEVNRGVPILGICLGMQLLADSSEEHGEHAGLGLIRGRVKRLSPGPGERVPNMGWCAVSHEGQGLFKGIDSGASFYFAHSYVLVPDLPEQVTARLEFGGSSVPAAVAAGQVYGAQFHPEKSQDTGLQMLYNYTRLIQERI